MNTIIHKCVCNIYIYIYTLSNATENTFYALIFTEMHAQLKMIANVLFKCLFT